MSPNIKSFNEDNRHFRLIFVPNILMASYILTASGKPESLPKESTTQIRKIVGV